MSFAGFASGWQSGFYRATRARSVATAMLALGVVALAALIEKRAALFGAASRALESDVFGLILPIALLFASRAVFQRQRLDTATSPVARFGLSRRSVGLGLVVSSMVAGALLAATAAAATALLAHDPTAPPKNVDAVTCAWIGALTASAYAGLYAFGASYGANGGGRWAALVFDFVVGGTGGLGALLAPRAHAQNLLGGEPPLLLSQPASTAALVAMAAVFTGLALARCPR